eukprot:TRINITY_DN9682_c0_g6_i2.p1 TRINITY_DN9682_c0_g6~~TRINITY_DN9682_c0_g6_i2.p1  ORF type:complete len:171 (-),score=27.30 TRINITY_DN9682_c0_g6_i2:69-581(-)
MPIQSPAVQPETIPDVFGTKLTCNIVPTNQTNLRRSVQPHLPSCGMTGPPKDLEMKFHRLMNPTPTDGPKEPGTYDFTMTHHNHDPTTIVVTTNQGAEPEVGNIKNKSNMLKKSGNGNETHIAKKMILLEQENQRLREENHLLAHTLLQKDQEIRKLNQLLKSLEGRSHD